MRRAVLFVALLITLGGCASMTSYPYPACLYDAAGRYDRGQVLAKRDSDDALFFAFADATKGDLGFQWVKPVDTRKVRRCREATLMDAADPRRREPAALDGDRQ